MKTFFSKLLVMAVAIFSLGLFSLNTQQAQASQSLFKAGVGGIWISSAYVGHDDLFLPYPYIHWEAKHVYVRGFSVGAFLWSDDNEINELSIGLSFGGTAYDADKTDNARMALLDDRDRSIDAYIQYIARTKYGHIGAKLAHDISGNADGFYFRASYKIPVVLGKVTLSPGVGFTYESAKRTDYYFGISHAESNRSGLAYYSAGGSVTPFVTLEGNIQVNDAVSLFASFGANFLSSEIKDSPMVDSSRIYSTAFGVMYTF